MAEVSSAAQEWAESLKLPAATYLDFSKYTECMRIPDGELLGSQVTWVCHNPEPGDIVRVSTSRDRITWVDTAENGGPANAVSQGVTKVWARAMVRRLATSDAAPLMDLHVKIDIDTAGVA
jgi:hypothetical protein